MPRRVVLGMGVLLIAPVAVAVYAISSRSATPKGPPVATHAVPKSKAAGQGGS
ncbi:MAG: hypothetical protein HY820_11370 [Acidobacteria bacterium]|nr:hypothetical protein [Acidobacteriota bacterium]